MMIRNIMFWKNLFTGFLIALLLWATNFVMLDDGFKGAIQLFIWFITISGFVCSTLNVIDELMLNMKRRKKYE